MTRRSTDTSNFSRCPCFIIMSRRVAPHRNYLLQINKQRHETGHLWCSPTSNRVPTFVGTKSLDGHAVPLGIWKLNGVISEKDIVERLPGGTLANLIDGRIEETQAMSCLLIG